MEITPSLNPILLDSQTNSFVPGAVPGKKRGLGSMESDDFDHMAWMAELSQFRQAGLPEVLSSEGSSPTTEYLLNRMGFISDGEAGIVKNFSEEGLIYGKEEGKPDPFIRNSEFNQGFFMINEEENGTPLTAQSPPFNETDISLNEIPLKNPLEVGEDAPLLQDETKGVRVESLSPGKEQAQDELISSAPPDKSNEFKYFDSNDFLPSSSFRSARLDPSDGSLSSVRSDHALDSASVETKPHLFTQSSFLESTRENSPFNQNLPMLQSLGGEFQTASSKQVVNQDRLRLSDAHSGGLSGGEFLTTLGLIQDDQSPLLKMNSDSDFSEEHSERPTSKNLFISDEKSSEEDEIVSRSADENFRFETVGAQGLQGSTPVAAQALPVKKMDAQVVLGAMARNRLATASIAQLSSEVKSLSAHGGEIRLRLKPDHLGEMSIRVSTQGSLVNLQVRAADEQTRKIIGESLEALREHFSAQNLVLGAVDLSAGNPNPASQQTDSHSKEFSSFQNGSQFQDQNSSRNSAEQRENRNPSKLDWDQPTVRKSFGPPLFASQRKSSSGQLDVTA